MKAVGALKLLYVQVLVATVLGVVGLGTHRASQAREEASASVCARAVADDPQGRSAVCGT